MVGDWMETYGKISTTYTGAGSWGGRGGGLGLGAVVILIISSHFMKQKLKISNPSGPNHICLLQTPKQGADNSLYAALSPELEGTGGQYFVNCLPAQSSDESYKEEVQKRLWKVSCELTGIPQ